MLLLMMFLCMLVLDVPLFAHADEGFDRRGSHNMERPDHEGDELGGLAALLFGTANFPVVLSILIKTLARLLPDGMGIREKSNGRTYFRRSTS